MNPLKSIFDAICSINKIVGFIYPSLPFLYSVVTVIFILLGIGGIIAFVSGLKFKNAARNIYACIHFTTTFFSMLILFHISYCSLNFPTNSGTEIPPSDKNTSMNFGDITQKGGGLKQSVVKIISKVFDFINSIIENNNIPFIIIHVICSTLIVIVFTFMSSIFGGIAKAGYQIHCVESKEVFNVPPFGNFVDFFMHILLILTCIFIVIYFFFKLAKDAFSALGSGFGLIPCNNKQHSPQELMNKAGDKMPSEAREVFSQVVMFMDEWPVMRAAFIISLSYYISQLFLIGMENIISNNIVLLTSWTTRETECSDEPNKKSKTDIERGFVLFGNILLFIILVIITLLLVYGNIMFGTAISKALSEGLQIYTPGAATLLVPLSYNALKATVKKLSTKLPGGNFDFNEVENQVNSAVDLATDGKGDIDPKKVEDFIQQLEQQLEHSSFGNTTKADYTDGIITKREKPVPDGITKTKEHVLDVETEELPPSASAPSSAPAHESAPAPEPPPVPESAPAPEPPPVPGSAPAP